MRKLANTKSTGHFMMVNSLENGETRLTVEFNSRWQDNCGVPLSLNGNNTTATAMAAMLCAIMDENTSNVTVKMNRRGIIALETANISREAAIEQLRVFICQAQLKAYNLVHRSLVDERQYYADVAKLYLRRHIDAIDWYRKQRYGIRYELQRSKEQLLLKLHIGFGPYVMTDKVLGSLGDKFLEFVDSVLSTNNCRITCYCDMAVNGVDGIKPLYDSTYRLVQERIFDALASGYTEPKEQINWKVGTLIDGVKPVISNWVVSSDGGCLAVANQMSYSPEAEATALVLEKIVSQYQSDGDELPFRQFETFYTGGAAGVFVFKNAFVEQQLTVERLRDGLLSILDNTSNKQLSRASGVAQFVVASDGIGPDGLQAHDWEVDRFTRRATERDTRLLRQIRQVTLADLRRLVMQLTATTATAVTS
ncbi:MAG: hypothetical protein Q4C83_01335 [Candidatus Saccharibacteria bacterium]|nr:hypothetical protein [Candidatus Saccharibacteria bacterium]